MSNFRKSTKCDAGTCVEAGQDAGVIAVRDATDQGRGLTLSFTPDTWTRFLATLH